MTKQPGLFSVVAVIAMLVGSSSQAVASGADRGRLHASDAIESRADASNAWNQAVVYFGVGLAAPVYFVNFMLLYMANPNLAANMPAYRAPLPGELSECLLSSPTGCDYDDFALSFDDDTKANQRCGWPTDCQTSPEFQRLAPKLARRPHQINEPLGLDRANWLAAQLQMDRSMILTDEEWECTIGRPPRGIVRETIVACANNLTNSNGNTNIPLASYGLAITSDYDPDVPPGYVQSLCAPSAPCLEFNKLFLGPLEIIAEDCGWGTKLKRLVGQTPFTQFISDGGDCQRLGGSEDGGACIVEPVCEGNGPRP